MLKACWDCIAGDQRRNEDSHQVHLNGASGPDRQSHTNGTMFPTPTLRVGNEIIIQCQMTEDNRLNIILYGSENNTLCELNVVKPTHESEEDNIQLIDSEGNSRDLGTASQMFNDPTHIIRMIMKRNTSMNIYVGESFLQTVTLNDDISKISVDGEVEMLTFKFK